MSDRGVPLNWARQVRDEAQGFGVSIAAAYHENEQVLFREQWENASLLGRIGIWLTGERPENSTWF